MERDTTRFTEGELKIAKSNPVMWHVFHDSPEDCKCEICLDFIERCDHTYMHKGKDIIDINCKYCNINFKERMEYE
jgi:hypothetical protein